MFRPKRLCVACDFHREETALQKKHDGTPLMNHHCEVIIIKHKKSYVTGKIETIICKKPGAGCCELDNRDGLCRNWKKQNNKN